VRREMAADQVRGAGAGTRGAGCCAGAGCGSRLQSLGVLAAG
jgi:hypothetical protein